MKIKILHNSYQYGKLIKEAGNVYELAKAHACNCVEADIVNGELWLAHEWRPSFCFTHGSFNEVFVNPVQKNNYKNLYVWIELKSNKIKAEDIQKSVGILLEKGVKVIIAGNDNWFYKLPFVKSRRMNAAQVFAGLHCRLFDQGILKKNKNGKSINLHWHEKFMEDNDVKWIDIPDL